MLKLITAHYLASNPLMKTMDLACSLLTRYVQDVCSNSGLSKSNSND